MSSTDSAQLIAAALASVDGRIQQQIEAARQRRERQAQQRAELNAARAAGIGRRNAAKLRHQANRGPDATVATPPQGAANDRGPARTPVERVTLTPTNDTGSAVTSQGLTRAREHVGTGGDQSRAGARAHVQEEDHA